MTGHACHLAQALPGVLAAGPSAAGWLTIAAEVLNGGQLPRGAELEALGRRAGMGRAATYRAAQQIRKAQHQPVPPPQDGHAVAMRQLAHALSQRMPPTVLVLALANDVWRDGEWPTQWDAYYQLGQRAGLTREQVNEAVTWLGTPRRAAS